jgi:hypothetical protein
MLESIWFVVLMAVIVGVPLVVAASYFSKSDVAYTHSSDSYTWQLVKDKRRTRP